MKGLGLGIPRFTTLGPFLISELNHPLRGGNLIRLHSRPPDLCLPLQWQPPFIGTSRHLKDS
jgi:hypothetical protein